jgi:hypothetical protein
MVEVNLDQYYTAANYSDTRDRVHGKTKNYLLLEWWRRRPALPDRSTRLQRISKKSPIWESVGEEDD